MLTPRAHAKLLEQGEAVAAVPPVRSDRPLPQTWESLPPEIWEKVFAQMSLAGPNTGPLGDVGRLRLAAPCSAQACWPAQPKAREQLVKSLASRFILGGPHGADALLFARLRPHAAAVTTLTLANIPIGEKSGKPVRAAQVVATSQRASSLDVSRTCLSSRGLASLLDCDLPRLAALQAGGNLFHGSQLSQVPWGRLSKLRELDLSGCQLRGDVAALLPLHELPELAVLNLSFNDLRNEGIAALPFANLHNLAEVRLCGTGTTASNCPPLRFSAQQTLQQLDLRENAVDRAAVILSEVSAGVCCLFGKLPVAPPHGAG